MASTNLNLTESFPLSDLLTKSKSPIRYTVNLESNLALDEDVTDIHTIRTINVDDSLDIDDPFGEKHTERHVRDVFDGLAVGDFVDVTDQNIFILPDFEENLILGEEFSELHTFRTILPLPETVLLDDDIIVDINDRIYLDLGETIGLVDTIIPRGTERSGRDIPDTIPITDDFLQGYGIKIEDIIGGEGLVNGLSLASLQAGTEATLSISLNPNWIFYKWSFSKSGITNIYDPNTTLIVPTGGGVITPILINVGVIVLPFNSTIIVIDPNFLEYNADPDGDYISTTEKITIAGDAVTVARHNITIEQGSTFSNIVIYRDSNGDPVDLTGYTAEMQIRKTKESSTILLTLSTSDGRLILGDIAGTIAIIIPGDTTDALDFVWGRYDLELYPGGDTTQAIRLLEGKVNLSKQVTQ